MPKINQTISKRPSNVYEADDIQMSDALEYLMSDIDPMNDSSIYPASPHMQSTISSQITNTTSPHLPMEKVVDMSQLKALIMKVRQGEISALSLFHEPLRLVWADEFIDFNDPHLGTKWKFSHYWDYICVEGKSFKPLGSNQNDIFQTVRFTLSNWSQPYGNSRYCHTELSKGQQYTIYCGSSQRLQWYFVLVDSTISSPTSKSLQLPSHRLFEFVSLLVHVFENSPALFKYGVNKVTFATKVKHHWDIEQTHWLLLQEGIFNKWKSFFQKNQCWHYWKNMTISMHMFDFGGNNTILLGSNRNVVADVKHISSSLNNLINVENIDRLSFALATEAELTIKSEHDANVINLALLMDTAKLREIYMDESRSNRLRIFPTAFSPAVCNFQSTGVPSIYTKILLEQFREGEHHESLLENELLSIRSFQGYSTIKQQLCPTQRGFGFGHSIYTGSFCVPEGQVNNRVRRKYGQLIIESQDHRPLKQIETAVNVAQQTGMLGYRFEPVVTIKWSELNQPNQTTSYLAEYIILPLLYIWETNGVEICESMLRGYSPDVYPLIT